MNDETTEPKGKQQMCCMCAHWQCQMMRPDGKMGIGACANRDNELAPYGIMTAAFGLCEGYEAIPEPSRIVTPKKVVARLGRN